jgi:hypothetical protein
MLSPLISGGPPAKLRHLPIARRPQFDSGQVALFLLDPHPKMPNMSLTRMEAGDLAAYIATLGR